MTHEIEKIICYEFKDKARLERALTHCSYNKEQNTKHKDNERLEFLGDAFLDAIVGAELFKKMKNVTEGALTKTRALIVCEESLSVVAKELNLGSYIFLGRGEEIQGGREKISILADAVEALIGAIYLDGGFDEAYRFVSTAFSKLIEKAISGELFRDYKSEVQEILQAGGQQVVITYITDNEEGPAHDKTFYVHMECDGKTYGEGIGKSKKEAEQNAAKEAISTLR